jgi:DNA-binding protein Fis
MATVESKSVYFTHDSNAFSDPKILKVKRIYGIEGYGIFFALLEKLSASNAYRISIKNIEDLAYDMRIDKEKLQDIIENYDLFEQETDDTGTYFYSQSHKLKMQYKDDRADQKRKAALARIAKLTPEELSAQNTKAARVKWDAIKTEEAKEKAKKDKMQSVLASDASRMQAEHASDALNKDKDKNTDKDKNENKDKDENKEQKLLPSASSNSLKVDKTSKVEIKKENTPKVSYVYNGNDIQEEIQKYHSNYFQDYNYQYVCDIYNDVKKETDTPMTLSQFDSLLWFNSYNIWKAENPKEQPTNDYINLFIKNNPPRIIPNDLIALSQSFHKRQEIREIFKNEVLKLEIIIPTPPRVFTQEELDNYEDLPI